MNKLRKVRNIRKDSVEAYTILCACYYRCECNNCCPNNTLD